MEIITNIFNRFELGFGKYVNIKIRKEGKKSLLQSHFRLLAFLSRRPSRVSALRVLHIEPLLEGIQMAGVDFALQKRRIFHNEL